MDICRNVSLNERVSIIAGCFYLAVIDTCQSALDKIRQR